MTELDPSPDKKQQAAGKLFAQGMQLFNKRLWSEAEASFIQSGRLSPTSLAWLAGAIAAWRQERFTSVATCVEWALHAIPIRKTPQSTEGIARFEAGDWAGVETSFSSLLNAPPVDTPTYLFLCIALINQGRLDEAGEQLMAGWRQEMADSEVQAES